jgi:hypothetical protein
VNAQGPSRERYKLVTSPIATRGRGPTRGDQHGRFRLADDGFRATAAVTPSGVGSRQVIGREHPFVTIGDLEDLHVSGAAHPQIGHMHGVVPKLGQTDRQTWRKVRVDQERHAG